MTAPTNRIRGFALTTLALVALLAQPALGFVEVEQNDTYEIALPFHDLQGFDSPEVAASRQATEQTLGDRYGSRWSVYSWNPQTGTPTYTYGTAVHVASSVGSASELDNLARGVIAANAGVLRADNANLRLSDTPNALGKWAAHYQQTYNGLDVWLGKVIVVLSEDGKLVVMGSDYYNGIDVDTNPSIELSFAEMLAKADLPFNPATDGLEADGELLILPRPLSATEVSFHLVWRVRVHTESPLGTWVTHVDAHTGEIIWRYNDIHFAYSGDTDSGTEPVTYCDGEIREVMPYLDVDVSGLGTQTSDSDGNWSFASGSGDRTVSGDLFGPYCNITNNGGPEAFYSGLAQEGVPHSVIFDDSNSQQDERDVFDAVNDIHDWFQIVAPEFSLPNNRMSAFVSIPDNCNAYWNGTINFFTEGGGCANTGEIQGVVHHEFGHGIQAAILGWQGNEGLGEGNSDIMALYMTHESHMGRGFNLNVCENGIRNADNNLIYPDDITGGIHFDGQIMSGFHWDALQVLVGAFGEETGYVMGSTTWHYGRVLMHPVNQPAQVFATFLADDDDNNLGNGTPHYAAYCQGASNHGFDCPLITEGVLLSHVQLDDTDDTNGTNVVIAVVTSTEADIDPSTVKVIYRHSGGAWLEILMTESIFGDDFTAVLPAQDYGLVEYYFYAEDELGNIGTLPYGAPAGVFDYHVAWVADHTETIGGWSVGDPTDTATDGIWVNVDPVGSGAQPEDDHTIAGSICWVTGQHSPGEPDDFSDVDGGKTTLFTPTWDLSNTESVQISFWYWLTRGVSDQLLIKVSNDGGVGYLSVGTFVSNTDGWRNISFDLSDYYATPGQVKLYFSAIENGPVSIMEAAIDDVLILADLTTSAPGDGFTVGFPADLAQNHPNPFNPVTEIKFSLEQAGPVNLSVFDAQGRLVRELSAGSYAAGEHRVTWNGQDDQGKVVASGVYLYRLEAAGERLSRRMLLIK